MSNQKGIDNPDANNSESEANNGENSSTQNQPQNSEANQSNRQDIEEGSNLSPDETSSLEIQELTSDESSQRNNSDDDGSVSIIYEFPNDSEENVKSEAMRQNQKRQSDEKNMHFAKKPKEGKPCANDNENIEKEKSKSNRQPSTAGRSKNGYVNQAYKDSEINSVNKKKPRNSSEGFDNQRHIVKSAHRLSKGKDNKNRTRIETHDKTNRFKRVVMISSTSSGALADVEDNADSQNNDDTSDDHKKSRQCRTSSNANTASTEGALADIEDNADSQSNDDISDDHEKSRQCPTSNNTNNISNKGASVEVVKDNADSQNKHDISQDHNKSCKDPISNTNSTELDGNRENTSVDINKESALQKQAKTDASSTSQRVVSESSTSTNQLKMRPDVGRLKKRRCFVCNKKLGLTAFTCRCGGLYCSKHRYDKEHDCDFDYKSMGAEEIRKNNPVIVAEKISKL